VLSFLLSSVPAVLAWLADLPPLLKWAALVPPFYFVPAFILWRERRQQVSATPPENHLTKYQQNSIERLIRLVQKFEASIQEVAEGDDLRSFAKASRSRVVAIREEADRLGLFFPHVFREAHRLARRIEGGLQAKDTANFADGLVGPETRRTSAALIEACEDALAGRGGQSG
jgi:hypothetical protein